MVKEYKTRTWVVIMYIGNSPYSSSNGTTIQNLDFTHQTTFSHTNSELFYKFQQILVLPVFPYNTFLQQDPPWDGYRADF